MKTVKEFLKRHTAAVLLLAVVLTMPVGTLWAKYAVRVRVTGDLSLSITADYTIDKDKLHYRLQQLGGDTKTLRFVKGSEVPGGLAMKGTVQVENSGTIGFYLSKDEKTAYIAPADASDSTSVMYAPADSSDLLNGITASANTGKNSNVTTIDCSMLDTSRVTDMQYMFADCTALETLNLGTHFDTSEVMTMDCMFRQCKSLTSLDLSAFDTSNVKDMNYMFYQCSKLTDINLSGFNTSKVTAMDGMFGSCRKLKTITVGSGFVTDSVLSSDSMFDGCPVLVGGLNTEFDSNYIDKTYARIDEGAQKPGYFTGASAVSGTLADTNAVPGGEAPQIALADEAQF